MIPSPAPHTSGLAATLLIITPPLAALAALAVPHALTLAEHPALALACTGAAAVAITAGALAVDEAPRHDPARTIWPLLLAWPLTFPWYMNRRNRLGSGIAGTVLLCGALAWSAWQIQRGHEAAAFLLQASGESTQASGEQNEAERQRMVQQRIDRILDAEQH